MQPPLILFVCTGNICRSPMAAALFRARAEREGHTQLYRIESAGTWGVDGQPASALADAVMRQRGLALAKHTARTVTRELIDEAALILVMTRSHRDSLAAEFPQARSKLKMMSQLAGLEYDISDPYGGPAEEYQTCAVELERLIDHGYPQILRWLDSRAISTRGVSPT